MPTPSAQLNRYFSASWILKELGSKINELPATVVCPLCKNNSMFVMDDLETGSWYCCADCGWSGDSAELFAEAKDIKLESAIHRLFTSQPMANVANKTISRDNIAFYLSHVQYRKDAKDFWKKAQEKIISPKVESEIALIKSYKLDQDIKSDNWKSRCGKFVGIATKHDICDVFNSARRFVPGTMTKNYLISPLEDLPGRISGFLAYDFGEGRLRSVCFPSSKGTLDAISFTENIRHYEEKIYGIGDAIFLMAFHSKLFKESGVSFPVIGWQSESSLSLSNLKTSELILWDRGNPSRVFDIARRVPEVTMISLYPKIDLEEYPFAYFSNTTPAEFIEIIEKNKQPWYEALRDYLISTSLVEGKEILSKVDIAPIWREKLLESCTPEQLKKMKKIIERGDVTMSVPMTNSRFLIQRGGAWYIRKDTFESLGSNAVPVIDRFITYQDGKALCVGRVLMEEEEFQFNIPLEEMTGAWLKKFVISNNRIPRIEDVIDKDLLSHSLAFSSPKREVGLEHIGYQKNDMSFTYPNFKVLSNGDVKICTNFILGDHPAKNLLYLEKTIKTTKEDLMRWFKDTPENVAYWAVAIPVLYNILAPAMSTPMKGVLITRTNPTFQDSIVKRIAHDFGLRLLISKGIKYVSRLPVQDITAMVGSERSAQPNIPLCVEYMAGRSIPIPASGVCLIGDTTTTRSLLFSGGWWHMRLKDTSFVEDLQDNRSMMLPLILSHYQTSQAAENYSSPLSYIYNILSTWANAKYTINVDKVLTKSLSCSILEQDPPLSRRFLDLLQSLINDGDIEIVVPSLKNSAAPLKTVQDSPVDLLIDWDRLRRVLSRHGVVLPMDELLYSLVQDGILKDENDRRLVNKLIFTPSPTS